MLRAFIAVVEKVEIVRQILAMKKGKKWWRKISVHRRTNHGGGKGATTHFSRKIRTGHKRPLFKKIVVKRLVLNMMEKKSKVMGTLFLILNRPC